MATAKRTAKLPDATAISSDNRISHRGWGYYAPLPGVRYYIYVNEETTKTPESAGERKSSEVLQGYPEIDQASGDGERR